MLGGHYEADDRPDRSMVDGLHHGRALEFGVFLAWPERHPANGNFAAVANEAWWVAGVDKGFQLGAICLGARRPLRQGSARAASAVVHAPAAAICSWRSESLPGVLKRSVARGLFRSAP